MALNAAIVWEVRSTATAANANGGGFKTGASGTDWTLQNAAQYNLTAMTSSGAGAVILHASAATDMVGNIINITSGTNFVAGRYEITAVSAGVSITVDRNCTTGVGAAGVGNIGGALNWDGTTDNAFIQVPVAGNKIYIKSGSYAPQNMSSASASGTTANPIKIIGYNSSRDDNPTSFANCPLLTFPTASGMGALGTNWHLSYLSIIVSAANGVALAQNSKIYKCKVVNNSATAARSAIRIDNCQVIACEFVSYRGIGISVPLNSQFGAVIVDCYIHDSDKGINITDTLQAHVVTGCLIESCVTSSIATSGGPAMIYGNTLFGSVNTTAIGINITAASPLLAILNNIITGFVTGTSLSSVSPSNIEDYNDYYNNDTDVTNITKGANDSTLNPTFTNVGQITGTNGTTSGSVLTSSGADFSAVVDGRDFVYLVSGTGITAGNYKITAHTTTTLTLDIAPGTSATADKVFQITTGRDFSIGTNLKALGSPGAMPGALTTSYKDMGAIQRQEAGGGSGMLYTQGLEGLG